MSKDHYSLEAMALATQNCATKAMRFTAAPLGATLWKRRLQDHERHHTELRGDLPRLLCQGPLRMLLTRHKPPSCRQLISGAESTRRIPVEHQPRCGSDDLFESRVTCESSAPPNRIELATLIVADECNGNVSEYVPAGNLAVPILNSNGTAALIRADWAVTAEAATNLSRVTAAVTTSE